MSEAAHSTEEMSRLETIRKGRWLPHQEKLEEWLEEFTNKVDAKYKGKEVKLHPVIEEFRELLDHDPIVRLYVTQMVEQVPHRRKYRKRFLHSVDELLLLMNEVISSAPEYNESGQVACPMWAVLDWCMGTSASFTTFRLPQMNIMIRKILRQWCEFLDSPESLYVMNDSPKGWKSDSAKKVMKMELFQHDPSHEHWGFKSWNDFFIRPLKPGVRPIAAPDNDKVIVNGCESTPYAIKNNIQKQHRFWIKDQPYSTQDLLANDATVDQFVGGTVFQAYLSPHEYHRWHSPVSGTIRKAYVKEGTYYSEAESEFAEETSQGLLSESQGYLAHTATRALFFIEAKEASIGLLCVMFIGMGDVSSCIIHPKWQPGQPVNKGEELGYFQFGGSSYCIVFRPGAISSFDTVVLPQHDNPDPPIVHVCAKIATAN
jgi:phosphatidylserine decarboxylase